MSRLRWQTILSVALLLAPGAVAAGPALAQQQQNAPHAGYVYPAGGRVGTTFQATIGGQFLGGAEGVHVSGGGVTAIILRYDRQLTPKEQEDLKKQLDDLQTKRQQGGLTPEERTKLDEISRKLTQFGRRLPNPGLSEFVTLELKITPDAVAGERELRLATPNGLSNPLVFHVGTLAEFTKAEWKSLPAARFSLDPALPAPKEMPITLPAVVNGQAQPAGVDRYVFQAHQGQHVVVAVSARALIPYMSDAVPGWFQAAVTLYDAKGREVAFADHYRFNPDPVLSYEVPADGQYAVEIRDSIYRGREDFGYRMAIGELPFITSIFPLGGKAGTPATVELTGWNLPTTKLTPDMAKLGLGITPLSTTDRGGLSSNRVQFAVDDLPEILEQARNDQKENAQPVALPVIVNGRVEKAGQWHVFRIDGRAGQEIVAEVYARRLGSPLDSVLKLTDADGKQLAYNDDYEDPAFGLETHHADSWLRAALPAGGTYYLYLGDVQQKGGPDYGYRLRVSSPRPDFELRVTPSSINLRAGTSVAVTVQAIRRDGFSGDIKLALKGAAAGFSIGGGLLPANQDQVKVTLKGPPARLDKPVNLTFEGRAMIQGKPVIHTAVPADNQMQAFSYRHLVPAHELLVSVLARRLGRNDIKVLSALPVKIPAGGTATVRVGLPAETVAGKVVLELTEPPDGIEIASVTSIRESTDVLLRCDAAKVKPGLKGNLIVSAFVEREAAPGNDKAPGTAKRRVPLGALPAIPFEVTGR